MYASYIALIHVHLQFNDQNFAVNLGFDIYVSYLYCIRAFLCFYSQNLMVRKEFKDLYDKLREERQDRKFTVKYGGVLLDSTRFGRNKKMDPFEELMNDPMTKLKEFLEKAGYRLIDLFKTFDRDQSWSIDLAELKEGIKVINRIYIYNQDNYAHVHKTIILIGNLENRVKVTGTFAVGHM